MLAIFPNANDAVPVIAPTNVKGPINPPTSFDGAGPGCEFGEGLSRVISAVNLGGIGTGDQFEDFAVNAERQRGLSEGLSEIAIGASVPLSNNLCHIIGFPFGGKIHSELIEIVGSEFESITFNSGNEFGAQFVIGNGVVSANFEPDGIAWGEWIGLDDSPMSFSSTTIDYEIAEIVVKRVFEDRALGGKGAG